MKSQTGVELVVLGSGTAIPRAGRAPSGYWLSIGGENVLLDSGAGTLTRLAEAGCPLQALARVFYTHLHPDHTLDLASLLFALTNPGFGREVPLLELYGPPGLDGLIERLRAAYPGWLAAPDTELRVAELHPDRPLQFPAYRVCSERTMHTPESQGYRFEAKDGGLVVAYTGDTDACAGVVALGRGADLLVTECSFAEADYAPGHLTPQRAGRLAREAGCRRLLLTHFYPSADAVDVVAECRREFPGEILLAADGTRVTL
jgi:ribonuclease BN (tRNA processing enzyme)